MEGMDIDIDINIDIGINYLESYHIFFLSYQITRGSRGKEK